MRLVAEGAGRHKVGGGPDVRLDVAFGPGEKTGRRQWEQERSKETYSKERLYFSNG